MEWAIGGGRYIILLEIAGTTQRRQFAAQGQRVATLGAASRAAIANAAGNRSPDHTSGRASEQSPVVMRRASHAMRTPCSAGTSVELPGRLSPTGLVSSQRQPQMPPTDGRLSPDGQAPGGIHRARQVGSQAQVGSDVQPVGTMPSTQRSGRRIRPKAAPARDQFRRSATAARRWRPGATGRVSQWAKLPFRTAPACRGTTRTDPGSTQAARNQAAHWKRSVGRQQELTAT